MLQGCARAQVPEPESKPSHAASTPPRFHHAGVQGRKAAAYVARACLYDGARFHGCVQASLLRTCRQPVRGVPRCLHAARFQLPCASQLFQNCQCCCPAGHPPPQSATWARSRRVDL